MVQLLESDIATKEALKWRGVHLIHFQGSACSQKTRIFLNLKGIDWEPHPLNLATQENFKPWFLGINPRGLVPVLVHPTMVLCTLKATTFCSTWTSVFPSQT